VGWHHNGLNRVQSVDRAASVALQEAARFVNGTAGSANLKSSCSEGNLPASAATQTARHVNHLVAAQLRLPSVECMTRPARAHQHIEMGQKWPSVTSGSTSHAAMAGRVTHRFTAPVAPRPRHGGTGRHRNSTWRPIGASGTSRWRRAKGRDSERNLHRDAWIRAMRSVDDG